MTLPKYPQYQCTDIPWIGSVPVEWNVKKIVHTSYVKGRVGWKGLTSEEYKNSGYANLVTGTDFSSRYINWKTCHFVDKDRYDDDPFIQLENGDLLITKDGTIGKLALVKDLKRPACLNSGIFLVRPRDSYIAEYLYWVLSSEVFKVFCDLASHGSTIKHLYQNVFEDFSFPVPPVSEQRWIVRFLDRETAKIDDLVAEQERLIALLKEKRQAVISHAVTKGLNPDAPMKDSGVEWLGQIPAHWAVSRIKSVAKLESGHTPSKKVPEYWENCHIPWVSLNDTKKLAVCDYISDTAVKISDLGLCNSSARLLPAGAVVFTRDATIGLAAITTKPMAVSQHLIAWCPQKNIDASFLLRVLNALEDYLDTYTFGATIKTIGMPDVRKLVTPLPPIHEQEEIAAHISEHTAKIDRLIADVFCTVQLLKERRISLISSAVTGKIDVRGLVETEGAA